MILVEDRGREILAWLREFDADRLDECLETLKPEASRPLIEGRYGACEWRLFGKDGPVHVDGTVQYVRSRVDGIDFTIIIDFADDSKFLFSLDLLGPTFPEFSVRKSRKGYGEWVELQRQPCEIALLCGNLSATGFELSGMMILRNSSQVK